MVSMWASEILPFFDQKKISRIKESVGQRPKMLVPS
jgi:hypothetical protein